MAGSNAGGVRGSPRGERQAAAAEPRPRARKTRGAQRAAANGPSAPRVGPIVSSAHLADGGAPALSEVEFGLILAGHAFARWTVRCMAAAGVGGLSPTEVLVLHTVRHRGRPKRLADICLVLGIEDTHLVTYAVKKLEQHRLVASRRIGKEKVVETTAAGAQACARYRAVRERLLVGQVSSGGPGEARLSDLGALLRALSGHYDQAARAATTL